ncbi:MAG: hypothetical protein ACI9B7_001149 [Oleispira sp.]|jgi:hypothetical protein
MCIAIYWCCTVSPYFIFTVVSEALLYSKLRIESWKMRKFNQKLICVSIATLALTACGGGSSSNNNSNSSDSDEHDHESSVLVSQSNTTTLSLLEEGELEALEDAAAGNGARLVLSETAAFAAVLSSGTVNFVHGLHDDDEEEASSAEGDEGHEEEASVLDFSLTGSNVITTSGHFAVLAEGSTTFIEYDELENDMPNTEDTTNLGVNQTYPALILDEEHDLKLLFDGVDALVYEGQEQEKSFTCATPTSIGQTSELVVVSCGANVAALVVTEDSAGEHTLTDSILDLDGTDENYVWRAEGHVIVGFEPNTTNYAVIELNDSADTVEVVKGSDSDTFEFTQNICEIKLDSAEQEILAISEFGIFVALDHEGSELKSIELDFSTESSCDAFVMASAAKTALLVDNNAQKGYEIDVDDLVNNPNEYHVHEDFDIGVSDIADMVLFHEKDKVEDEHDH